MKKIKAFIFDLDGTLLNSMILWRDENRKVLDYFSYPVDATLASRLDTAASREIALLIAESGRADVKTVLDKYLNDIQARYLSEAALKPGAPEFLEVLRRAGVKIFLASATPVRITGQALARHNLLHYFEQLFDDESFGVSKADAEFYRRLCAEIGFAPDECAMFEDSPYSMRSANQAGLTVFGIYDSVIARTGAQLKQVRRESAVFVRDFYEAERAFVNYQ